MSSPICSPTLRKTRFELLDWIRLASKSTVRKATPQLRAGSLQERTLFLGTPYAEPQDVTLALEALSRLKDPWILGLPWRAVVDRRAIPPLVGARAVQLFLHLSRAILLGRVSPRCFPTQRQLQLATFPLTLDPTPDHQTLLHALTLAQRSLRHGAPVVSRTRTERWFETAESEGYGRNGSFRLASINLSDHRHRRRLPYLYPFIEITARSASTTHRDPLRLELSEPDAHAFYEALGSILATRPHK